jgi:hypothetical protein
MNIGPALVTHAQPPKAVQPGERSLHHPPPAAEALTRINRRAGDPTENVARAESRLILPRAIGFVCMQFVRPLAWAAAAPAGDADYEIDHVLEQRAVVHVRRRELDHERDALRLGQQMVLRARLATIRRIRAGVRSPFFAGTLLESRAARDQSSWLASLKRSSKTWCSVYHTPASCQSRRRRQQVMPLPQPISGGSISQGMPLFNTNRIPVSAARSDMRGRPPLGFGDSGGSRTDITAQSSSLTNCFDCFTATSPATTRLSSHGAHRGDRLVTTPLTRFC